MKNVDAQKYFRRLCTDTKPLEGLSSSKPFCHLQQFLPSAVGADGHGMEAAPLPRMPSRAFNASRFIRSFLCARRTLPICSKP
jgi:hypothetical protein